ncbi:MAG: DUF3348 domain-containing protein [Comamonadaceae bacterium]|nr:DUF3348 domain-containing protein [Comamonadaceae bacterium]
MLHGSTPGAAGPELAPLLARLGDGPPVDGSPEFAERMGHWLGWAGAISLSTALNAAPAAGPGATAGDAESDFRRVCAEQEAAIAAGPDASGSSPDDFGPFLRHCLARQQAMHDAVAALRRRLRDALRAAGSPQLARLAAIDAALEQGLAVAERRLLALVPQRLEIHFDRLRRAAGDTDAPWPRVFRDDLDLLLRAELAHRLLPARGLLDALRPQRTP